MKSKFQILVILLAISIINFSYSESILDDLDEISGDKLNKLELFIKKQLKIGKIPGASIVIVEGNQIIYQKGFGYSNIEDKKAVTPETLFELGSTSKAFTGLGLLKLVEDGMIDLDDSVEKYIPWFQSVFNNKLVNISIAQCLYQTSGIPFKSIDRIPVSDEKNALERTIKNLSGVELDHYPGTKFSYATINYDILGLVIEKVMGTAFEEYISKNILTPLQLSGIKLDRNKAYDDPDMAVGYKLGFFTPRAYSAPPYRGNTPAGYFISNIEDLARWIKIHLNTVPLSDEWLKLIAISHNPDRSVSPDESGASYAAGWSVYQSGLDGEYSHGGNNPNFSSFIAFRPDKKIGIGILANMNSSSIEVIGYGMLNILQNRKMNKIHPDLYKDLDNLSSTMICLSVLFMAVILFFSTKLLYEIFTKKRKKIKLSIKVFVNYFGLLIFLGGFFFCIYLIPNILFKELS